MSVTSSPQGPNTGAAVAKEIRFSVVMYGGVSLAIYMNGITQELWRMVRSTARKPAGDEFRFAPVSTESVYREVARHLNETRDDDVRFMIDNISGTSAGGINGIFLAKALADGRLTLEPIESLWINEGAIERLLNDAQTTDLSRLPAPDPPKSLLSGDHMYLRLLYAFDTMMPAETSESAAPLCDNLDLFVTTTDIHGRVLPLRLADRVVWERRYRSVFRMRYEAALVAKGVPRNDMGDAYNLYLAFAARCTSSFPFAFPPMQLKAVDDLRPYRTWKPHPQDQLPQWITDFFQAPAGPLPEAERLRPFGDGGYLNNRPFQYVIDMLGHNPSNCPTERKLIYVEPSPEHPERERDPLAAPTALENSYAAMVKLPGEQPIRDEIERVVQRNRLVRKVIELTNDVMPAISASPDLTLRPDSIGDFSYIVLRAYAATDDLAETVASWFGYPTTSDYYYALRCLVRAWREAEFENGNRVAGADLFQMYRETWLENFDLSFWFRTCSFLRQQINLLYGVDRAAAERLAQMNLTIPEDREAFRLQLRELKPAFDLAYVEALRQIRDIRGRSTRPASAGTAAERDALDTAIAGLAQALTEYVTGHAGKAPLVLVLGGDVSSGHRGPVPVTEDENYMRRARQVLEQAPALRAAINAAAEVLSTRIKATVAAGREVVEQSFRPVREQQNPARQTALRAVEGYYDQFELFDAAIFPIIYQTDVQTPEPVSLIRFSPEDATAIVDEQKRPGPKLAGASLSHFGAFLDRSFRVNDILWGRLDGAERIIRALLYNQPDKAEELITQAQEIILREFAEKSRAQVGCFVNHYAQQLATGTDEQGVAGQVADAMRSPNAPGPQQLAAAAMGPDVLRTCLAECPAPSTPNPQSTLESISRATRIMGGILGDLSSKTKGIGGFVSRIGSLLWLLVEAAVPMALAGSFYKRLIGLLLCFEAVMIAGGTFFSQPAQSLGFKLLIFTVVVHLVWDGFRRYMLGIFSKKRMIWLIVLLVTAMVAGVVFVPKLNHVTKPLRDRYTPAWVRSAG